jgi:hypothetical protein
MTYTFADGVITVLLQETVFGRRPGSGRRSPVVGEPAQRSRCIESGTTKYVSAISHADRRTKRPKVSRLAANGSLRAYVQDRLAGEIARPGGKLV